MRARSTDHVRLPVSVLQAVMYVCENRLPCPRKAKSVLASTHCWSAETLKVGLKVKIILTSCFISLWMKRRFERAVEWTVKDSLKDNETSLTDSPSRTRRWNINIKSILSVRFEDIHIYITMDWSYCQVYVLLCRPLFCHSLRFTSLPVSTRF